MRNRFFFIILTTLIGSALGINFVHVYFFKNQRLSLIDRQISEGSNALLGSEEFHNMVHQNPQKIEDTISKVLQGARIGKVFVLRDPHEKIIYQSFNVGLLQTELPVTPEWVAIKTENEYVRIRNVPIAGDKPMILQVGLVLDRNFLNWEILDQRLINYMFGIVVSIFIASAFLTLTLLSPLRLLIKHLNDSTASLVNQRDVNPLPARLTRYSRGFWAKSDEFSSLVNSVQKLIDRINLNYKLTRSWTLQMAHELKTPLTIILAETDSKNRAGQLPEKFVADVKGEVRQMSEIISQFLNWAELENSRPQRNLHALKIKSAVHSVAARIEKISPGRIRINMPSDFSIFANPGHLDQLITNLISNALKFSPETEPVEVVTSAQTLAIIDHGGGLPDGVKERIGEPFNVGPSNDESKKTGNGLGLAWVATVAKLYDWEFEMISGSDGTKALLRFPLENRSDETEL